MVLNDATLLRGVEGYHAAPWCLRISRLFVKLKDATVLRGVEGYYSVVSSNTTEQRDILQHHGAERHPPTPRSIVASFNTTKQRGIIQRLEAA
jgi:PII-like signaling protein